METTLVVSYPYERILVAILGATLAIFLILAIIIAVKVIKLLDHVERIAVKAEDVIDKVEEVGESVRKAAGTLAVGNVLAKASDMFFKKKSGRKNRDED